VSKIQLEIRGSAGSTTRRAKPNAITSNYEQVDRTKSLRKIELMQRKTLA